MPSPARRRSDQTFARIATLVGCKADDCHQQTPATVAALHAPDAPAPVSAYTQAVEVTGATRTLYISGQVGIGPDGTIPEDIVAQSRLAWANLTAQIRAAGMTLDNVVKVVTILPNAVDVAASRTARQEALGDRKPASTLIIGGLANPAWKIEVEAVAVV